MIRTWWVRPLLGACAALALVAGGLVVMAHAPHRPAVPTVTEVPPVTVPYPGRHWPN